MPFIAPLIGAVVGAIGAGATAIGSFIGGLGFLGQALISIGLNVATALIQRSNRKEPPGGVQFDRQYGANVPRQVAIGLVGLAGHDCYVNTFGDANKFLQQVYVVSDYYCDGMSRVAINGEWATLGSTADADKGYPVTSGEFANLIWVKFFDGTQTTAEGYLVDNANPAARWTAEHIGLGMAFFLVSMTYDKEKNNQFPDFFFEFRGARLYDWRKDSTAGGSGSHRWGDYSTHAYSANPILADYNYRRGFSVNGDLFCGMEMETADLPLSKYTAAAAICDESISLDGGGHEPRYQLSLLIDCTATHGENIESMMLACGGMVIDGVDGSWPLVGSDQPSVAIITDDDFIAGAPFQFRAKRSMSEIVNSVSGNSPDPSHLWSMVGYEPQISDTALVVDRRTRDLNIDFPQVPSLRQSGQLASIYLEENRWEATASGMLRPRWQVLEPGDWITWNSTKYGTRTMMVAEAALASLDSDGPRNAQLSLQERDGTIYDGILNPPVIVPSRPGEPTYLAELDNFQAIAVAVSGADDRQRPGIRTSWNSITDETVDRIELRYWPKDDADSIITKVVPADGTVAVLTDGVVSATLYRIDSKIITDPLRTTAHSSPIEVTTLDVRFGPDDLYPIDLAQLGDDIQGLLDGMQSDIGDNTAAIAAEAATRAAAISAQADALADEVSDRVAAVTAQAAALAQEVTDRAADVAGERADRIAMGSRQALDLRSLRDTVASAALQISDLYLLTATDQVTMRKEIVVSEGNARAYSDTQLTLAVGPGSALAAQLAALGVSIAGVDSDLDAAITSLSEAIADGDAGEASARQALELQVRGSYTGTDLTLVTEGLLYQERQTRISEDQALSTAIELVSAGVGILFDWSVLWSYNTSADGWAGNGAPTVSNGWLRPANHATDPYVLSPDNLDIDGDAYKQVKLRIRKTGTPAWQGQFWWQGDGDTTWDAGRRITIAEPSYVDGIAVITVDFAWSGTIKRIREDLSSDQDASNYFEIDWNSIGRPSPGASQAQVGRVQEALSTALAAEASDRETLSTILVGQADPSGLTLPTIAGGLVYDEKTARVAGDSALSTLITGVQATLDDQADDIDALTTAQTTMQTAIDTLGDQVTLNASNIDDVEASLAGKADTAVTDALSAEIETMGGGAVASQVGQALRDIRLQLDKLALANFDLFATGQQQRLDLSGALVNVQQALTGRIDTTAGGLTLLGQAVTAIQLALPDYATLAVTDVLDGRVTATESSLTSAGSAITAIQAQLPNKASVSAVEAAQDAADAAQADADAANTLAATKADATALDSLAATVTSQGGTISSHGSAITSLSNSLDTTNANVTTAQGAADAAQAAADAALTSADGKSDVLFQSATPASGYRNSKTLWIDTTGSANTPKRWDGSNWVTATDKVATDAAAAATAAQATADAANALAATKASTTVTDDLQSQITSGAGGSSALAQTLRAVRASIDRLALSQFDLFAGGAQQRIDLSNIVASVNQSLTSRVDVTDGNVAVVVGRVDKLDATIPGLASLGITSALDGRITANEAGLTSQGTSITAIQAALDGYTGADAVATAISSLDSRVTATESANTSQSTSITNLTNSLATTNSNVTAAQSAADAAQADADALETSKADASTVSALSSTVTSQGGTLTSQGGAITSLQNALTGYTGSNAVANAISSLNTTVTGQGDDIDALSAAVTSVQSSLDDVSASGKFRIATQATSAGAQSTIGLIAEVTAGAETHTAGLLIDALSSGKSRVIALGDQFVFANPADLSNLKNAIVFDGAKAYLDEINLRELNASEVTVTGRFDASLILQDGTLITDLMAIDAVSEYANFDHTFVKHLGGGQSYSDGGWVKVKTTVVDNTAGKPMIEFVYLECTGTLSGSGNAYPAIRIVRNGVQIAFCQSNNAGLQTYSHSKFVAGTPATYTYDVYRNCDALTGGSSSAICDAKSESGVFHWKR